MNRFTVIFFFLISFLFLQHSAVRAQADYSFINPILQSGTDLQPGAVYKFSNVKANADAKITIMGFVGGVSLNAIDDKSIGYSEAFQPSISTGPGSNGYVEFKIEFFQSGTENLQVQNLIPVSCIDMDGVSYADGKLYNQDQVQFMPGYFDYNITGNNLKIFSSYNWITIRNTQGINIDGTDTTARDLMATVVNSNTSAFLIRIGAVNTSLTMSAIRNRNVYFKKFTYSRPGLLPNRTMLSLSGKQKNNGVELKGTLSASHSYDRMIIERASKPGSFELIAELDIIGKATAEYSFAYFDNLAAKGINYYRIQLLSNRYNLREITNTLMVKTDNNQKGLEVINSIIQVANPAVTITSSEIGDADIFVYDTFGYLVKTVKEKLNTGYNSINLFGLNLQKGYFVLSIQTKNSIINKKVFVQ
jgi:hypothetical protein